MTCRPCGSFPTWATSPDPPLRWATELLVRFDRPQGGDIEARVLRTIGQNTQRVIGVVRKTARDIRVEPVDRRSKDSLILFGANARLLNEGDLVLAQVRASPQRHGPRRGKVLEVVGREDQPRAASLIAIHAHGIPMGFSSGAEQEASRAAEPTILGREDLRDVPFVTIDPADARDHDDAVFAQPDLDPKNAGWMDRLGGHRRRRRLCSAGHPRSIGSPSKRATASISRIAWSQCCRSGSPVASARCARAKTARA